MSTPWLHDRYGFWYPTRFLRSPSWPFWHANRPEIAASSELSFADHGPVDAWIHPNRQAHGVRYFDEPEVLLG